MKKVFLSSLGITLVLFLVSWGFKGHQAVATIAENHLTPQAKAAVKGLLVAQSLSEVATWADPPTVRVARADGEGCELFPVSGHRMHSLGAWKQSNTTW